MISTPEFLLTLGGIICMVSLWMQAIKNLSLQSAKEISWFYVIFSFVSIGLFVTGKLMLELYYAVMVDAGSSTALGWILTQKIKDRLQ